MRWPACSSGEFTQSVGRVECERFPRGVGAPDPAADLSKATGRYSCLAITADAPRTEVNQASSIGYPYRALVNFETGRFGYCKISGRPGEGSLTREFPVRVPAACGGVALTHGAPVRPYTGQMANCRPDLARLGDELVARRPPHEPRAARRSAAASPRSRRSPARSRSRR